MSDLIRKSDALEAVAGWEIPSTAIASLPAVTVGVKPLVWNDWHFTKFSFDPIDGKTIHAETQEDIDCIEAERQRRILAALEPVAAPDPAAIREAALRWAAAVVEDHLLNWANDLAETRDLYREALNTGKMNGRNISETLARKCARDFNERAEAVAESAEHTRDAILALLSEART